MRMLSAMLLAGVTLSGGGSCASADQAVGVGVKCILTPIALILEDPRPWIGKRVCIKGELYNTWSEDKPGYVEGNLLLVESMPDKEPDDVALSLDSFDSRSDEEEFAKKPNGTKVTVSGVISTMEDCWDAVERGELEDPCLPYRRPIFVDRIKILAVD